MERIEETPMDSTTQAENPSSPGGASTSEDIGSRSLSPVETSTNNPSLMDSFDYPDDEATRNKILAAAIQQEDEFLEYLMSLPAAGALLVKDKSEKEEGIETEGKLKDKARMSSRKQPPLFRSTSEKTGATVGLDHLDNLCRLMEQLGDLREKNSKLQRRVQYLEDLKKLQEMHTQLQQETKTRRLREAELLHTLQRHRDSIITSNSPRRSKKLTRQRQTLQPSSQKRERSQSVGIDELNDYQADHNKPSKRRQRRSIAEFAGSTKGKVSKWTKVKEAFRWEKASVVMLPETKSQDSGIGGISHHCCDEGSRYLRVPVGEMVSGSPSADSVISSHSMCSSGGPSTGDYAFMPLTSAMISSSSSSEELDFDYNYTDIVLGMGPQRSASATESVVGQPAVKESRRLSLRKMPEEEDASRRSKSLDGDDATGSVLIARHFATKDGMKCSTQQSKSHKTPWGKVKDIIQTRKDSLKQRQHTTDDSMKRRSHRPRDGQASSDHDDAVPVFDPVNTAGDGTRMSSPPPHGANIEGTKSRPSAEVSSDVSRRHKTSTSSLGHAPDPTLANRRLTPMLTITLPSTEELSQLNSRRALARVNSKPPPSPQTDDRVQKIASLPQPGDETNNEYRQHQASVCVGTSPPVHRRSSKWTKVKKAFLTSTTPGHRDDDPSGQLSCSVPSSPNRTSSFFYETDPEELSGGELAEGTGDDDNPRQASSSDPTNVHAEIQRNYEALQQKLSQEFHKKLHEWEKMKASGVTILPNSNRTSATASGMTEDNTNHDKRFRRKMEEWERMKHKEGASSTKRESVAFQQLDEDNLSPHFKKKLQEWQRIKKIGPRDDNQQSRKRLVEWQLWRTGSGKQGSEDQDDFQRKLQEWERIKSASPCESPTSKEGGTDSDRNSSGAKTPSPGVIRKNSTGNAKKKVAGGNTGGKSLPKTKTQKEKELHWLEKELQKIEREKQRLEREREKYLEREARLEKMRRAVGSNPGKEVLVQTSTGFFRFQGISEKFTRRLYEWEKARGIAPEASTFALLDPGYQPKGGADLSENGVLTRSKSASSVTNLTGGNGLGANISHQQSSLSLNDVDGLEQATLTDARSASDPQLRVNDEDQEDDEPSAVIVDVEDVVEETAELLAATPAVQCQTPVYCYAPEEVTRLIDSSGSDTERDCSNLVRRTDSVRTESSYKLIEENINLLSKLQLKGDICRKLETDLEDLEEKINHVRQIHEQELERLHQEEREIQQLNNARVAVEHSGVRTADQKAIVSALRTRIQELERRQERLKSEGVSLQDSFVEHTEEQSVLAQNLVGKMKQLQEVNSNMTSFEQDQPNPVGRLTRRQEDAVALVQGLSTQLLSLAERLEGALGDRNREIQSLRQELNARRRDASDVRLSRGMSADGALSLSMGSLTDPDLLAVNKLTTPAPYLPRQSSVELTQLPSLLTHKVLELKQGLSHLSAPSATLHDDAPSEETTTFVMKLSTKKQVRTPTVEMPATVLPSEQTSSPVTVVTITPAFFRRQAAVADEQNFLEEKGRRASDTLSQESFSSAISSSASSINNDRAKEPIAIGKVEGAKDQLHDSVEGIEYENRKSGARLTDNRGVLNVATTESETEGELIKASKVGKPRRSSDTLVAYKRKKCELETTLKTIMPLAVIEQKIDHTEHSNSQVGAPGASVNVFVPTTRKIFSPVRRDSKGKASSVIGYVVEEESECQDDSPQCVAASEAISSRQAGMPTTPPWMIMRSRSQSSSPALPRRRLQDESGAEGSVFFCRGPRLSTDSEEGKLSKPSSLMSSKENVQSPSGVSGRTLGVEMMRDNNADLKYKAVLRTNSLKETSVDREKRELTGNTTPLGFPPLPPSPSPGRRDLFKQIAKDTAPSIRMMIAKYNQKLTEQDGGRSPEVCGSGSGSPVAWRSPVAERRVRTQMAKYQEEVQRVLQQGGRRLGRRSCVEVQKSASAGFIRSNDSSSSQSSSKNDSSDEKAGTPSLVRRGILKSSSAGSIKPVSIVPIQEAQVVKRNIIQPELSVSLVPELSASKILDTEVKPPETVDSPISTRSTASSALSSPPMSRLRALRLQRAKEEFLTRGPGGRSWTSEGETPWSTTPSLSPEPRWTKDVAACSGDVSRNRLSQVSVGSESSYDSQVLPFTPEVQEDDGGLLIKSASAGMINVDSKTFKKFSIEKEDVDSTVQSTKEKSNSNTKFGISSITSKFRKVKMRKNKDKEGGGKHKLNTVSLLCRQSLLVDIHKKDGGDGPSTSKSCPSSPVLQRTSSTENAPGDEATNRATGSWILNPAKKIFKPK